MEMSRSAALIKYRRTPKGVLTNIYQHMKARANKYNYEIISLNDLHNRFMSDHTFLSLLNDWIKARCPKYLKPSIDRKNADLGYTLDNMQIMTWSDNFEKGIAECSRKKWKPVSAIRIKDGKIFSFSSQKQAIKKLNLNQGLASAVLNGQRTHTKGYKLNYSSPQ